MSEPMPMILMLMKMREKQGQPKTLSPNTSNVPCSFQINSLGGLLMYWSGPIHFHLWASFGQVNWKNWFHVHVPWQTKPVTVKSLINVLSSSIWTPSGYVIFWQPPSLSLSFSMYSPFYLKWIHFIVKIYFMNLTIYRILHFNSSIGPWQSRKVH